MAILGVVVYHVVQRLASKALPGLVLLSGVYLLASVMCFAISLLIPELRRTYESILLEWRSVVFLAAAVLMVELGFLWVYRSGATISLAATTVTTVASVLLMFVGVCFFREKISPHNIAGAFLCVVGIFLISKRG